MEEPFLGSRASQLTEHQLRHDCLRIYRDVYVRRTTTVTAAVRAKAAWLYAGEDSVLTGFSAAALYGTKWIDPDERPEIVRPGHFRPAPGMVVRDYRLLPDEIAMVDGIRVTTPERAAFDLGRRLSPRRGVAVLDALCNATDVKPIDVLRLAEHHRGARGIVRLRSVLDDVDGGAESPPESHTRMVLVEAGLPRPETQINIIDGSGRVVARADMGWRRWRVLVEYDGEHHWTDRGQRAWDIDRTAILESLGWAVIRVGAQLLYDRPHELIRRVRAKLTDDRVVTGTNAERRGR
ncbi:type IV toxin-antitoxin system AbiEi family antitoxin [Antrihabitans cavernicola]|uniref:type IV toxin-antitoxin system AbiEi family antitoxin n=1 Tax=Antrihabitans cavernicola TaxID=2495913 RepID=UPI00338E02A4